MSSNASSSSTSLFKVTEIEAKSIVSATKVPSADYVINPYTGCQFACMYCFASFMGRFVGKTHKDWGNYVFVKTNAVALMRKEILRLTKKNPHPKVVLSTVTDPYQGVEKKYRLTRGILETFVEHNYQGRVGILTKSPMVLDDVALLGKLANVEVGLSITAENDSLTDHLEVHAPHTKARLTTLKKLNDAGINTYVFVGPFLPHMTLRPDLIDSLFGAIKEAGTRDIKIEYLNLPTYVRPKMNQVLESESDDVQAVYATSQLKSYREQLEPILRECVRKHGFTLKYDEIVHHESAQELRE